MRIAEKRQAIGVVVSTETVTPEVSPDGGADLCQGESGSGASLGAAIASLTERCGVPAME
jgi:hypothetical protein